MPDGNTERAPSEIAGRPASMRRRLAAVALDYLPIAVYLIAVTLAGALMRIVSPSSLAALFGSPVSGEATCFVLVTLPVTLYFVVGEASRSGATWGKRRLGLRVVTSAGERLTAGRSLLRTTAKFLPWELSHAAIWRFAFSAAHAEALLFTAWALVGLTLVLAVISPRRHALHDRLASTTVVQLDGAPQPGRPHGRPIHTRAPKVSNIVPHELRDSGSQVGDR